MSFLPRWSCVQVKCSSECRTGFFLPKISHNFWLKTRSDKKTITIFSGNPVFYQIVICTREMHFWQLRRQFCVKKLLFFQISKLMKKLRIDRKNIIKVCSGDAKRSFVKSASKKSPEVKNSCALNPKIAKKKWCSSENFFLFSEKFSALLEVRSDGRVERFQTVSDTFVFPKNQKLCKNCYNLQRGIKISSNDRLYT